MGETVIACIVGNIGGAVGNACNPVWSARLIEEIFKLGDGCLDLCGVEIVEGLSAGDVVVSAGQMKLRPGAAVQAAGTKPAAATQGQP